MGGGRTRQGGSFWPVPSTLLSMLRAFPKKGPGSQVEQEKVTYLMIFFAGVPGPSDGMGSNT